MATEEPKTYDRIRIFRKSNICGCEYSHVAIYYNGMYNYQGDQWCWKHGYFGQEVRQEKVDDLKP